MHEIHGGPETTMAYHFHRYVNLVFAVSLAHCGSGVFFFLALTVSELRAIFLFPGSTFIYLIVS